MDLKTAGCYYVVWDFDFRQATSQHAYLQDLGQEKLSTGTIGWPHVRNVGSMNGVSQLSNSVHG